LTVSFWAVQERMILRRLPIWPGLPLMYGEAAWRSAAGGGRYGKNSPLNINLLRDVSLSSPVKVRFSFKNWTATPRSFNSVTSLLVASVERLYCTEQQRQVLLRSWSLQRKALVETRRYVTRAAFFESHGVPTLCSTSQGGARINLDFTRKLRGSFVCFLRLRSASGLPWSEYPYWPLRALVAYRYQRYIGHVGVPKHWQLEPRRKLAARSGNIAQSRWSTRLKHSKTRDTGRGRGCLNTSYTVYEPCIWTVWNRCLGCQLASALHDTLQTTSDRVWPLTYGQRVYARDMGC